MFSRSILLPTMHMSKKTKNEEETEKLRLLTVYFLQITCRENPKCRKMDINSFLMAPVQRVTK